MNYILLYLFCGILIYLIMRKHINNYFGSYSQNNIGYMIQNYNDDNLLFNQN
jgi:hypothetical protein